MSNPLIPGSSSSPPIIVTTSPTTSTDPTTSTPPTTIITTTSEPPTTTSTPPTTSQPPTSTITTSSLPDTTTTLPPTTSSTPPTTSSEPPTSTPESTSSTPTSILPTSTAPTSTPPPTTSSTPTTPPTSNPSIATETSTVVTGSSGSGGSLATGSAEGGGEVNKTAAIAGGVAGGVALLAILGVLGYLYLRRRQRLRRARIIFDDKNLFAPPRTSFTDSLLGDHDGSTNGNVDPYNSNTDSMLSPTYGDQMSQQQLVQQMSQQQQQQQQQAHSMGYTDAQQVHGGPADGSGLGGQGPYNATGYGGGPAGGSGGGLSGAGSGVANDLGSSSFGGSSAGPSALGGGGYGSAFGGGGAGGIASGGAGGAGGVATGGVAGGYGDLAALGALPVAGVVLASTRDNRDKKERPYSYNDYIDEPLNAQSSTPLLSGDSGHSRNDSDQARLQALNQQRLSARSSPHTSYLHRTPSTSRGTAGSRASSLYSQEDSAGVDNRFSGASVIPLLTAADNQHLDKPRNLRVMNATPTSGLDSPMSPTLDPKTSAALAAQEAKFREATSRSSGGASGDRRRSGAPETFGDELPPNYDSVKR